MTAIHPDPSLPQNPPVAPGSSIRLEIMEEQDSHSSTATAADQQSALAVSKERIQRLASSLDFTSRASLEQMGHRHFSHRSPWLRAAVLGANDGLVSTSSLLLGVTAGTANNDAEALQVMILTGIASIVAGALSMALGEYVSVYSQRDAETADIQREREEFLKSPEAWKREERELALIYQGRGLTAALAAQVARELHSKHLDEVVKIHARDELGIDVEDLSNPLQAAVMSALTFATGAAMPLLAGAFIHDYIWRIVSIVAVTTSMLFAFGTLGAVVGGAPWFRAGCRVLIGGWIAMAGTFGIGRLFGVVAG